MRTQVARAVAALVAGTSLFFAASARAQAGHYPAMQPAGVVQPEANFIISGFGDYGMSFVGQYRFLVDKRTQVWFDVGVETPSGATYFLVGGAGAWNFMKPSQDKPIDLSATLGVYGAFAGGSHDSFVRIPIGIDVGHTFKLDNGNTLQIFGHPRVSVDICTSTCSGTYGALNFDLGASYEITPAMYGRAAFTVGGIANGPSDGGFGISLAIKTGGSATKK
jgi:hypothetical protein